jgi:hypothetical protein
LRQSGYFTTGLQVNINRSVVRATAATARVSSAQEVVMRARWLLASVLLAGCSGYSLVKPDPPPVDARAWPPPGWAQVCVLRPHWIAAGVTLTVHDDGVLMGATRGPSYFCYYAEPGPHQISSEEADAGAIEGAHELRVTLEQGRRYFLHQRIHPLGHFLEWVDEQLGERMAARCGYRVLARAPAGEPLPPQPPVAPAQRG